MRQRMEALQRIFEHEIVHLIEQLCWENSDCAARRFRDIAERLFLHRAHTHDLITRRERAAESGIHVGSRVTFSFGSTPDRSCEPDYKTSDRPRGGFRG